MKHTTTLLTIILLGFSFNQAIAQTGTANLNITLSSVLSLTVSQPASLTIDFNDATKYTNGILAEADDHLTVVSSSGYIIKAISGAITTNPSGLTAASVKLTTTIGGSNSGNTSDIEYVTDLVLPANGGSAATVITADHSSWSGANATNKFKVAYNIGSASQYINKAYGDNIIPVVYTITQP